MTSSDYEKYVTQIVRQFDFCKHAKISNNRKFQGKRQPGEYEIDIAVEVRFSEAVDFLMIIECKYWNRPVDRPVIQSVAQTKDAISAHKAVIATVQGFSKEAISVAEAHSIALWRVDPEFDEERKNLQGVLYSLQKTSHSHEDRAINKAINKLYYELRSQFCSAIDVDIDWDEYRLHAASINTILTGAYAQITSQEDWRQVEALERLAQWEDSSIQKLTAFEIPTFGKIPEHLIGELLRSVAGDDQEAFQSLIKYREMRRGFASWFRFVDPDFLDLHLR
jgi:Restriction endonuclease